MPEVSRCLLARAFRGADRESDGGRRVPRRKRCVQKLFRNVTRYDIIRNPNYAVGTTFPFNQCRQYLLDFTNVLHGARKRDAGACQRGHVRGGRHRDERARVAARARADGPVGGAATRARAEAEAGEALQRAGAQRRRMPTRHRARHASSR